MSSVGEEIQVEIKRVRDVVIPQYEEIGDAGKFAIIMMKQTLDEATKALAEGNVVSILRAYQNLKDITA